MADLIARLRKDGSEWCEDAADEIEKLRRVIEFMKMRAANLAALLQSATGDARNIGKGGLLSFFESLTPEQQEAALRYRGPENHGNPNAVTEISRTSK